VLLLYRARGSWISKWLRSTLVVHSALLDSTHLYYQARTPSLQIQTRLHMSTSTVAMSTGSTPGARESMSTTAHAPCVSRHTLQLGCMQCYFSYGFFSYSFSYSCDFSVTVIVFLFLF